MELSPQVADTTVKVVGNLERWETAFYNALVRAREAGELKPGRDLRALARFLTSSLQGLRVLSKVRPERAVLEDVVRVTLSILD